MPISTFNRNSLRHDKLNKCVDIYTNVRMLKQVTDPSYSDEALKLPLETRDSRRREAEAAVAAAAGDAGASA